jgi:hypothetical protein
MIGAAVGAALVLTVQNLAAVVNLPSIILGSSSNNNNSPSAGVNDIKNKRAGVQFLTTSIDETINLHSTNNNNPQGTTFTAFPNWPAVRYHTLRSSTMTSTNNEKKNDNGVKFQPAKLVQFGPSFITNRSLLKTTFIQEFVQVYKRRPEKDNVCGIRFTHAYALWLTVKLLQPKMVIESGVNSGISSWFIRQASATAVLVSIDPELNPICGQPIRWLDTVGTQVQYLGPDKFVDFMQIDWNTKMVEYNVSSPDDEVLVYFDDHLAFFPRVATLLKYGFRHVILEDNYKVGHGATPGDKWATPKQLFNGGVGSKQQSSEEDALWLLDNLITYAEFPPLVSGLLAPSSHKPKPQGGFLTVVDDPSDYEEPILRPELYPADKDLLQYIASELELDASFMDALSYTQLMNYVHIAYMEFKPFAPTLRKSLQPIL